MYLEGFKMDKLAAVLAGYLLGSVNFSILITRFLFGKDIRDGGSGNAGATNTARQFGIVYGVLVLAGDVLKAVAALYAGTLICGTDGILYAGAACVAGHCYPVFHRFKGGKGVAVGATAVFAVDWRVGACAVLFFAVAVFLSKKVSLGSVIGAMSVPVTALLISAPWFKLVLAVFVAGLVIARHAENIKRLRMGTEPDFSLHPR